MSEQEIDYEVMDLEQLRERVSLLEMKLAFERDWRKGQEELASRIDKAKAILCATIPQSQLALEIIRAVEALEGKPLVCQECGQAFRPGSAHPRKYCSYECAHRATDRDWHRRKRAEALEGK